MQFSPAQVRRKLVRGIAVLGVLAVLIPPAYAGPTTAGRRLEWAGICTEAIFATLVESKAVDDFVPPEFTLSEAAPGKVPFAVTGAVCHDFSIHGEPHGSYQATEAVVAIQSPDGSDGVHLYNTWQVIDSSPLRAHWISLGMYGARLDELSFESQVGVARSTATLDALSWDEVPYSMTVNTSGPQTPIGNTQHDPEGGNGWHLGDHGLIQISFALGPVSSDEPRWVQTGEATLSAPKDTPIARILGVESATGVGIITRFSFDGRARLVETN